MGALIDRVIEEIKADIAYGDVSAIEGLLENVPEGVLIDFLPEEEWDQYENKFICNSCGGDFHAADRNVYIFTRRQLFFKQQTIELCICSTDRSHCGLVHN